MGYSKSELISQEAVKATCVQTFQNQLYIPDLATGRAGPRMEKGRLGWGGTLENKTPDHVTTWIQIAVTIFDADGTKHEVLAETATWIDPLGETEFQVELPEFEREQFDQIKFCDLDNQTPKACMSWVVTDVKGLAI